MPDPNTYTALQLEAVELHAIAIITTFVSSNIWRFLLIYIAIDFV
jgi:hypothetical protein